MKKKVSNHIEVTRDLGFFPPAVILKNQRYNIKGFRFIRCVFNAKGEPDHIEGCHRTSKGETWHRLKRIKEVQGE